MLYFLYGVVVIDFVVERSPLFISSSPFFCFGDFIQTTQFVLKKPPLDEVKNFFTTGEERRERKRELGRGHLSPSRKRRC